MAFLVLETDVQTVTKEAGNNPKVFFRCLTKTRPKEREDTILEYLLKGKRSYNIKPEAMKSGIIFFIFCTLDFDLACFYGKLTLQCCKKGILTLAYNI